MRGRRTQSIVAASVAAMVLVVPVVDHARADPNIGQFEIKSLDAESGEVEFQSQNAFSLGQPRQQTATEDGTWISDDNSVTRQRHALEVEYGFSRWLKGRIGIEYEKERAEYDTTGSGETYEPLKLDEYAAELILVAVRRDADGFGLGFVVEYEYPTEMEEAKTLIAGPIFEWAAGSWLATFNPLVVKNFGGERNDGGEPDEKLDFSYTGCLMYQASKSISLAVEAYGTVERIGNTGARSDEAVRFGDSNQHRIGPVLYWTRDIEGAGPSPFRPKASRDDDDTESPAMIVGIGVLMGLNNNTPDATLKLSVEAVF